MGRTSNAPASVSTRAFASKTPVVPSSSTARASQDGGVRVRAAEVAARDRGVCAALSLKAVTALHLALLRAHTLLRLPSPTETSSGDGSPVRAGNGSPMARSAGWPFRVSVLTSQPCCVAVLALRLTAMVETPSCRASSLTVTRVVPRSLRDRTPSTVARTARLDSSRRHAATSTSICSRCCSRRACASARRSPCAGKPMSTSTRGC